MKHAASFIILRGSVVPWPVAPQPLPIVAFVDAGLGCPPRAAGFREERAATARGG